MRQILLLGTLVLFLSGCKKYSKKGLCDVDNTIETIVHNNEIRNYVLYLPESYTGTKSLPLLLNFHGYGGLAKEYMKYADFRSLADEKEFILVYPQGSCLDGMPHWNAGLSSAGNKSSADDFGFIETLITELIQKYNVDSTRIYACGLSNGGMFSYALACYKSNLITAVGVVSGTMLEETRLQCTPLHYTPVIIFHGTKDNVLPEDGSEGYLSVEEIINYWKEFNQAHNELSPDFEKYKRKLIVHKAYTNPANNVSIEYYKIVKGSHEWFNIEYQNQSTEEIIWNFFENYNLNALK